MRLGCNEPVVVPQHTAAGDLTLVGFELASVLQYASVQRLQAAHTLHLGNSVTTSIVNAASVVLRNVRQHKHRISARCDCKKHK